MELILGLIFVTSWVMVAPKVLADAITTMRASKAGKWDLIDKDRDRRATRSERRSAAVAAVRKRRNKEAGGSGAYEPGFRKYARDLYTGFWKRQCEKLTAKEKARPPYVYDPNRPGLRRRMRAGVVKRTSRLVDRAGGVGRLLFDPVGEKRQPADVVAPRSGGRGDGGPAGTPVDPWLSDGDEPTVEIAADGLRTACPVCGDTLTEHSGVWLHPAESTCRTARRPDGGYPVPQRVAEQAAADAQHVPDPNAGMEPVGHAAESVGDPYAGAADNGDLASFAEDVQRRLRPSAKPPCRRCMVRPGTSEDHLCGPCVTYLDGLLNAVRVALTEVDPDGTRGWTVNADVHTAVERRGEWRPRDVDNAIRLVRRQRADAAAVIEHGAAECTTWPDDPDARAVAWDRYQTTVSLYGLGPVCPRCNNNIREANGRLVCPCTETASTTEPTTTEPTSNGGIDMSAGTIDLVDYNQAVAEHERALEQLRAQYAQACAFEQHVTGILGAVEAMDAGRSEIADALAPLSEGMEGSRYGGDATQGSAEATSALTAGSIAEVQEHVEAAADRNQRWKQELAASIEGVQASLQHIKSQYGEAAATVQETGIDARALEEH